jgi:hypothetical protein
MDLQEFNSHRKHVSTERGEIAYVEVGDGPVALFVHGVLYERPDDLVAPLRRHWAAHPARDAAWPG